VRKDLVRKVKTGANVPVFVLEFLLGKYCASADEMAIQMGLGVRPASRRLAGSASTGGSITMAYRADRHRDHSPIDSRRHSRTKLALPPAPCPLPPAPCPLRRKKPSKSEEKVEPDRCF
jgi:hypothetical protein